MSLGFTCHHVPRLPRRTGWREAGDRLEEGRISVEAATRSQSPQQAHNLKTLLSERKPDATGQTLGDSMWMRQLEQACSHRQKVEEGCQGIWGWKLLLHGAAGSVWQDGRVLENR